MDDCTKYTICACGTGYEQTCAAGLTFDSAAGQCQPTGVCVSSPTLHPNCNNIVGLLPHPNDCFHYFLCAGAAPIIRRCSAGLLFSRLTNRCEVAGTVTCVGSNPLLISVRPRSESFSFAQLMWSAQEEPIKYVPMELSDELLRNIEH